MIFFRLFLLAFVLCSCSRSEKTTLKIFTWAQFIDPEVIEKFEKEYNCCVCLDYFDSNESMYAKIQLGAQYDLLMPSSYFAQSLNHQNLLATLDKDKLPNLKHLDSFYLNYLSDSSCEYSVPYILCYTGIGYLKNRVEIQDFSWKNLARKDLKIRTTILNDYRESLGIALMTLGFNPNTINPIEIEQAGQLLIEWKRNIAKFENEQYKMGIDSGEFLLCHGYSGDFLQVALENPSLEFFLPSEGFFITSDVFVIPKKSSEHELAHAFINFMHEPDHAAANMVYNFYLCPNKNAYKHLPDGLKNNRLLFIDDKTLSRSHKINDLGEDTLHYLKVWENVKNN